MLAGAISCFFMMAFIPFSLFLVSIFGYILGQHNNFHRFFLSQVVGFFPQATHQITRELQSIVTHKKIGIVTLLIYGIFSYQLYVSLEMAVHQIFKVKIKRPLIFSVLLAFLTVTLLIAFVIFSFGASGTLTLLGNLREYVPGLKIGATTCILSKFFFPALLLFFFTTSLYMLLPRKKVLLRDALWGGLFTTLCFEGAKHLFTFYVSLKISRLGAIYGSLTVIVIFLMWLFYSSSIFLVGAELVRNLGNLRGK